MEFRAGQRVQRPKDADAAWYGRALIQLRRQEAGDIEIRIETVDGPDVVGYLDQISGVLGRHFVVRLAEGHRIDCEDIEAITVISMSD